MKNYFFFPFKIWKRVPVCWFSPQMAWIGLKTGTQSLMQVSQMNSRQPSVCLPHLPKQEAEFRSRVRYWPESSDAGREQLSLSLSKDLFIYLFKRALEGGRVTERSSYDSSPKTRGLELCCGFLCDFQEPNTGVIFWCFPSPLTGNLIGRRAAGALTIVHMGSRFHMWQL